MGKRLPNKAERRHLAAVAALGCVVCRNMGYGDSPAEIHHIKAEQGMGQRAAHYLAIPLCPPHHRIGGIGVAYHAHPKEFERKYGSELDLLAQTIHDLWNN